MTGHAYTEDQLVEQPAMLAALEHLDARQVTELMSLLIGPAKG